MADLERDVAHMAAVRVQTAFRRRRLVATSLQAAFRRRKAAAVRIKLMFRVRRARRAAWAKYHSPSAQSYEEFRSNLEPYVASASAKCIAIQWDETVLALLGSNANDLGYATLAAVWSSTYASLLALVLLYVQEPASRKPPAEPLLNARLANLLRMALQTLVGWA